MNSLRSPAVFRTILCDTSEELEAMNSTVLPNGATLYDNETSILYRLFKNLGATFDDLIPGRAIIKPNDDTSARWVAQTISGATPFYYESYLASSATVTIAGSNTWALLGNVASSFARANGSALAYDLSATTGQVTYSGPPILAAVRARASLGNASGGTPIIVSAAISHNNDIASGATGPKESAGMQQGEIADGGQTCIPTERILLLAPGSTLRLAFRNTINGDDLSVAAYQLIVNPL